MVETVDLLHLAYRQVHTSTIRTLCGEQVDPILGDYTIEPDETNCLRCYEEARKRWAHLKHLTDKDGHT